ncbi:hypothetical protein E4U21_006910 [Claviceps maximensis]|nr:hypothetical protein E4U21_006910 [Claviceps maximensis]
MAFQKSAALGYRWRSSKWYIASCIAIALFSDNFLQSYIVPILPVMLETRLHVDKSQTQAVTSLVLSFHAGVSMLTSPLLGYLADRAPSRKISLIASLAAQMMGTIVIMTAPSVPVLLVGRGCQAIGGNAAWIVGLATLTETVGQDDTGKMLGAISSIFSSGLLFGPMASGMLLPLVGYWMTWFSAIAMLALDLVMRLVMIEKKQSRHPQPDENVSRDIEAAATQGLTEVNEQTALLHDASCTNRDESRPEDRLQQTSCPETEIETASSSENFYKFMFTSSRALTAIACHTTMPIVLLGLDTTLPLHAYRTFGWNTAQVSLMFLLLQLPSLLLATVMGIIKDKSGTRLPTGVGLFATAIFLWLLGAAAEDGLSLLNANGRSQIITMISLVGLGTARTLVGGSGILEITNVVKDALRENPTRFGPNGKLSSAYSITNFFWCTGMLIGPILSGGLTRTVGYYHMNISIAILCCISGVLAFSFLSKK